MALLLLLLFAHLKGQMEKHIDGRTRHFDNERTNGQMERHIDGVDFSQSRENLS